MAPASGSEENPAKDGIERQPSLIADKFVPSDYSLSSKRKSVLLNAGPHVPQLTIDDFFANFLPKTHIKPTHIKAIHARVLLTSYEDGRWKSFPLDPGANKDPEGEAFLGLVDIAKAVRDEALHCVPRLRAQTKFDNIPDSPPEANNRPNKTRPDGYFVRADAMSANSNNPHWVDIAATGEYKKSGLSLKQLTDDISKALWSMHHTMREDASRRFTYAFTIENRTMRLWFASRSEILVSESFDFMDEPERLVDFFLAFTFASKEELGWDPTMKCRWNGVVGSPFQYDITVREMKTGENTVYRTQELLSDVSANHIRGRGTRVWKVKKVYRNHRVGKTEFILKDSWTDSNRPREGEVLADIRASTKDATVLAQLDKILLTMFMHGDVHIGDTLDQTVSGDYRDTIIRDNKITFSLNHVSPNATATGSSGEELNDKKKGKALTIRIDEPVGDFRDPPPVEEPQEAIEPLYYSSKIHYRIVFEEVCVPLHSVTSLRYYVYMLLKASRALSILHSLGWVHRDISAGNILLFKKDIKLADLEYAQSMNSTEPAHDIRTGTEAFMAVEVKDQGYCFTPFAQGDVDTNLFGVPAEEDIDKLDCDDPLVGETAEWTVAKRIVKEGWRYNPLHDMESVGWLFARPLFYQDHYLERVEGTPITRFGFKWGEDTVDPFVAETAEKRIERIKAYYVFGRALFVTRTERYRAMYRDILDGQMQAHPLFPGIVPLGEMMKAMRNKLVEQYQKWEMDIATIDHTCAKEVTLTFMHQLHKAYRYLQDVAKSGYEIKTRSLQSEFEMFCQQDRSSCSAGTKRPRDEEGDDEEDSVSHPPKLPRTETRSSPRQSPVAGPSLLPAASPAVVAAIPVAPEQINSISTPPTNHRIRPEPRTADVPPPTRTLRSHVRKTTVPKAPSLSPKLPSAAPLARSRKPASRKGKATKNNKAVHAAAKIAAKVKSKTRKGR